jgi:peroxiredoxin
MAPFIFGMVLPWLLIAFGIWLGYQLVRQNGRILLRLESIEQHLPIVERAPTKSREPKGLPIGTPAPDFELPDLAGAPHKLSEFRERNVLLVFFNPQCGYCTRMAADLAALSADGGPDHVVTVVVTTGDAEENRKLVEKYGIRCAVLLQKEMQVAAQYQVQGTPMGYRIDTAGRIASELAVGAEPLLKLAGKFQPLPKRGVETNGEESEHHVDPSLARSKINRNGLTAGTTAPDFRLPRIDGGELSLSSFQGGRTLLVFSDPNCGPCDQLAPRLEQIHAEESGLQVLMISRRDVEATRAKAASLGLSFPIVMQRQWEISLLYGKFATPIAYLIDEQGVLLSDVAVGVEPILSLADQLSSVESRSKALSKCS